MLSFSMAVGCTYTYENKIEMKYFVIFFLVPTMVWYGRSSSLLRVRCYTGQFSTSPGQFSTSPTCPLLVQPYSTYTLREVGFRGFLPYVRCAKGGGKV